MSYQEALEAAGAEVHDFKEFGCYQGEWYAYVTYQGETGVVTGSYGSCSGCDAFDAEFGWEDSKKDDYQQRLAAFGETYLTVLPASHYIKMYKDNPWYNGTYEHTGKEVMEWLKGLEGL